jgi:hypothetical protein
MPGLRLTVKQAQRLWGLDEDTCTQSLEVLAQTGFLVRTDRGTYSRLTEGTAALSSLPPAARARAS